MGSAVWHCGQARLLAGPPHVGQSVEPFRPGAGMKVGKVSCALPVSLFLDLVLFPLAVDVAAAGALIRQMR